MPTPHISSEPHEIATLVLMPGDPLRAKYIAENFLEDYRLVNDVRNMYFYTGYYKGIKVTIASSGMGIPSMGIYAYELINNYNVKRIIRIGTCGSFNKDIKIQDLILSLGSYSYSYFPKLLDDTDINYIDSSKSLNEIISNKAKELNISIKQGKTITSDVFDVYCDDINVFRSNYKDESCLGVEMEAFALYFLAKKFNIEATTLMTVVDSLYDKKQLSSEEREKGLNEMINLALESLIINNEV
jgi:purine-nucleoside phosphorylase